MEHYNLDKLIKVTVNDLTESSWYGWSGDHKILGVLIFKSGFYNRASLKKIVDGLPEHHFLIDGEVFEYPEVILHYEGNYSKTYYFETYQDAKDFAKSLTNDRKWIN